MDRVYANRRTKPLSERPASPFLCCAASAALLLHSVRLRISETTHTTKKPKRGTEAREGREMAEATAYEEQRRRQVEANKRKLEELQLHHLSAAVREAAAAAKPSPVCPGVP
jgi:hypothetical protein